MAVRIKSALQTLYTSTVGLFKPNTNREITNMQLRACIQDMLDSSFMVTTATGIDTYSISDDSPTNYTENESFLVIFTNANTGAATLNRNSLGAKDLKTISGAALTSGQIVAGGRYLVIYNGTYYMVLNIFSNSVTLDANSYSPSYTNTTNVTSSSGVNARYMRVGSVVTVSGAVSVQHTAGGTVVVEVSLPIASNFGSNGDAAGGVTSGASNNGRASANITNDTVDLVYSSGAGGTVVMFYHFTYIII